MTKALTPILLEKLQPHCQDGRCCTERDKHISQGGGALYEKCEYHGTALGQVSSIYSIIWGHLWNHKLPQSLKRSDVCL